jgi:membrane-associated phospholipid phosphatase
MILKKRSAAFCLAALFLFSRGNVCLAQSAATNSSSAQGAADVAALPDAPQPQSSSAPAQSTSMSPSANDTSQDITLAGTPRRLLSDQKTIWLSPLYIRPHDASWLLPLSVTTGLLIASDQHTMTSLIHVDASGQHLATQLSNGGLIGLALMPASMYLWSFGHYAPQARETGLLTGEALVDTFAVTEVAKWITRRDRPTVNDAQGDFFSSSPTESSFPSNHSAAAWSMASVIGEEYPGWLTRTAVYGLATGISVSRVLAEQHFPSDVLVGSAVGWLIGHYVYDAHHRFDLFHSSSMPDDLGKPRNPRVAAEIAVQTPPDPIKHRPPPVYADEVDPDAIGSTFVPMDSWIYPALERLGSMGFVPGQSVSIRPWTRQECLRQLNLAEELAGNPDAFSPTAIREARRLMNDLHYELATEPPSYKSLNLQSVYARVGTIAGPALYDSFHFGQTWWNDYGRPLGRGTSGIAGFSLRAHQGRFFFYYRPELQRDPGRPDETPAINQLINALDRISPNNSAPVIEPVPGYAAHERQRPIELYAGMAFEGNAISFGKQEIYWGPTTMGPLAFSSNAEPTYNLRFEATRPHPLPFFPRLGTYRFDLVLGKLSGHSYPERPWYNGQKADFNFGENLEISFTRWSIFWGVGHPITVHTFKNNIFSFNSTGDYTGNTGSNYGDREDPGDRKSNFDFRYRLPGLRKVVTLYADAYSDDDPSPLDAPRRAVWNPGIYFARLPWLPHMDLRVEAVSSEGLATDYGGGHFFINGEYLDGNTNKGFLLGNAIGRDARAIEGRSSYWFSARTRVEGGYRQNKGGTLFLPGGATITDGFVNGSYAISHHWTVQAFTQYERFLIPSYMNGSQHNVSGWLQLTWTPGLGIHSNER